MEPFRVFVSSTSRDLMAERKAVAAMLTKSEWLVTAMEHWDAIPSDATTVSVDGVSKCNVFVGIYGSRYGFIPPGGGTSITEPYYPAIAKESLSAYFLYIARRLIRQAAHNQEVLKSMHYLNRCEVMGVAEELALATVEALFSNIKQHFGELNEAAFKSTLRVILDYLRASGKQAKDEYAARGVPKAWDRVFYREWVLRFFCVRVVRLWGVDAYQMLAAHNWYQPEKLDIVWPVSVEMHREANFALSDWYRREKSDSYLKLIQQLVNNRNSRDREIALYLIRHSMATHGQRGLAVDSDFAPMLEQIFLDPRLSRIVERFYELFRINLWDFENIEQRREKNLADWTKSGERSRKPGSKLKKPDAKLKKPDDPFWVGVKGHRDKGKRRK